MDKISKIPFLNSQLLDRYISKIKKIPWILGRDAFLFVLIFILLDIIFGEFLFYKHVLLVNIKEPEIVNTPIKFQENVYQSVLKELQIREDVSENLP